MILSRWPSPVKPVPSLDSSSLGCMAGLRDWQRVAVESPVPNPAAVSLLIDLKTIGKWSLLACHICHEETRSEGLDLAGLLNNIESPYRL